MSSDTLTSVAPVHRFILLTDIAQSSRLAEQYPSQYEGALGRHNQLVEQAVTERGGEVYKQTGDGYLVLFETARMCLDAALELGEALGQLEPLAAEEPLLVRLAMHAGELKPSGEEYFGPALNRVSRICQVCNPGQVLLSDAVEATLPKALDGFELRDLGQHHLRDLAEPERLYQLDSERFSRHEFPPLTTLNNRPNNLVEQPNAFIGRERELKELAELLLDSKRLVSITAPGGYGKSRLAAQLCANLLHRFEQGVFMVYLAPVRGSLGAPTAIANALSYHFSGSRTPEQQLCDYLRSKDLLLCLDNFEHLLDSAPLVPQLLAAAPRLKVLITSREPLRVQGELTFLLEPLQVAAGHGLFGEAELLFADRAALVNRGFTLTPENREEVSHFCEHMAGIPLAIELAAAWMDSFTMAELHDELTNQLELESRASDLPPRHQSLKASLDWSWNLLGAEQQEVLMRLSTFRGGFFSEAAGALLGLKGMALRAALGRLSDKSWLYTREVDGQTRFFLRDMLALEYACGKLQESNLFEPAVVAHAVYFTALMDREGPRLDGDGTPTGQLEALATIRLEQRNVDEAFDTLLSRLRSENAGEETVALLLPIASHLVRFLDMTAAYRELVDRYQVLKQVASQAQNLRPILLWALLGYSHGLWRLGDYDSARNNSRRASLIAKAAGDRNGIALSLSILGSVERVQGNYDAARRLHAESLAIRRDTGDRYGSGASVDHLGHVELSQGNYDAARELYAESLEIKREIGDRYGSAGSLTSLGIVEFMQGNSDAALMLFTKALGFQRELGDRSSVAATLNNLGLVAYNQGNYDAARQLYAESLAIQREIGNRSGSAGSLNNLGEVEYGQGNFDAARELCAKSLAIRREIGIRRGVASPLHNLAFVHLALQEYAQAEKLLSQALAIRREVGNSKGLCESLAACASLLDTCHLLSQAAVCLYGVRHCAEHLNYHLGRTERELLERALEMIEHPDTGLAPAEREQLKALAEAMSLDELAEFALAALAELKDIPQESESDQQASK